jgi:hypothetical protein
LIFILAADTDQIGHMDMVLERYEDNEKKLWHKGGQGASGPGKAKGRQSDLHPPYRSRSMTCQAVRVSRVKTRGFSPARKIRSDAPLSLSYSSIDILMDE